MYTTKVVCILLYTYYCMHVYILTSIYVTDMCVHRCTRCEDTAVRRERLVLTVEVVTWLRIIVGSVLLLVQSYLQFDQRFCDLWKALLGRESRQSMDCSRQTDITVGVQGGREVPDTRERF